VGGGRGANARDFSSSVESRVSGVAVGDSGAAFLFVHAVLNRDFFPCPWAEEAFTDLTQFGPTSGEKSRSRSYLACFSLTRA